VRRRERTARLSRDGNPACAAPEAPGAAPAPTPSPRRGAPARSRRC